MKALVKTKPGIGNLEIRDMPMPVPGDEDILVKVAYCGLCGTDIHIHNDEYPNEPPVIIGHEFSGIVEEVGKSVSDFVKGDRVVSELHTGACRNCWLCKSGFSHICPGKRPIGSKENGALSEFVRLPAWLAHKIPGGIDLRTAAMCEPLAIVCHCLLEQADIKSKLPGNVLILGASTIGLITTIVVRKSGIPDIAVAGTNIDVPVRLPLARELGASLTINTQEQDLKSAVNKSAGSDGTEAIVECSGSTEAIGSAIRLIRRRGRLILLGLVSRREVPIPWNDILYKEIDITSSFGSPASSWEKALKMLPDIKFDLQKIITHTIPLEDWQQGFELMKTGQAVKVMVEINKGG